MPKPYPPEFRAKAVALVRAGRPAGAVVGDLSTRASCLQNWLRQDRIDRGEVEILRRRTVDPGHIGRTSIDHQIEANCVTSSDLSVAVPPRA